MPSSLSAVGIFTAACDVFIVLTFLVKTLTTNFVCPIAPRRRMIEKQDATRWRLAA
jgi:hypothetical protein